MKNKEKRTIHFFDNLAKLISGDAEALDALHYYYRFPDIFRILQYYGYLTDMTLDDYVETALQAADDLKFFLDPDTGEFSEDAVSNEDEAAFKDSFKQRHDLILKLMGLPDGPARFPLIVEVENGRVRGDLERLHRAAQWFGIPYAAPAAGENRWRKPQPAPQIERVLNCTKPGERNLQCLSGKTLGVEGRLTLNICRPNSRERGLPVMVYFHGGNFQTGQAEEWLGNKFSESLNVVHVSVEYRLGALGFNPLPALWTGDAEEDSGNFVLLDMIAALQWVHRNIAAFGGDPANVTISGFSAGGRAVAVLLTSRLARGLFHRAVCFSAGFLVCEPEPSRRIFAERFAPLAVEHGVRNSTEEAEAWLLSEAEEDRKTARQWLYSLSGSRLAGIFPPAWGRMELFPIFFRDGTVVPSASFDDPDMNHVPVLLFYSTDEFSILADADSWFRQRRKAQTPENPDTTLEQDKAFSIKYGSLIWGNFNSHQLAESLYPHLGAPVYIGKFHYGHEPREFGEEFARRYGALHGVYLPFLTDQYKSPWKRGNDFFEHVGAEYLGTQLLFYIGKFMECGSLDSAIGPDEAGWPAWKPELQLEMFFDGDRKRGYVKAGVNEFCFEDVFARFDADTSISEESKAIIASRVFNHRIFSREWDARYGNPPDPTQVRP
jgi:para-nitrobenzyl esterase